MPSKILILDERLFGHQLLSILSIKLEILDAANYCRHGYYINIKYLRLIDAPHYDMMQGSQHIQSRLSRHGVIVSNANRFVSVFAR